MSNLPTEIKRELAPLVAEVVEAQREAEVEEEIIEYASLVWWKKSKKGNLTTVVGNYRGTVYQPKKRRAETYRWLIFKVGQDTPQFSNETFWTKREAMESLAEELISIRDYERALWEIE